MLLDQWSYGRIDTNDVKLRNASGVDPGLGMNFGQVGAAIKALFDLDVVYSDVNASGNGTKPLTWHDLKAHLRDDGSAVVCGNYNSLRGFNNMRGLALDRWQPGGTFGHALHVCDYDPETDTVKWQDPLGHGAYDGDRTKIASLWAFIWKEGSDGSAIVTASYGFRQERKPPLGTVVVEPEAELTWAERLRTALADCEATSSKRLARIRRLRTLNDELTATLEEATLDAQHIKHIAARLAAELTEE